MIANVHSWHIEGFLAARDSLLGNEGPDVVERRLFHVSEALGL